MFFRCTACFALVVSIASFSYAQDLPPALLGPGPAPASVSAEDEAHQPGIVAPVELSTKAEQEVLAVSPVQKVQIGGGYIQVRPEDLFQSYVAMGGLDLKNPDNVDYYASIFYCGLFKEKYENDFEWNGAREQISAQLTRKILHHTLYEIPGIIFLQRYNFESQDFPLRAESAMFNVGSMLLSHGKMNSECRIRIDKIEEVFKLIPALYMLNLRQVFTFDRLKIPMDQAEQVLKRMEREKNNERKLYVRFRVKLGSLQDSDKGAAFSGELTAVDVFFDQDMTEHLVSIPID